MDKTQMIVRVPTELKDKLKRIAKNKGLTLTGLVLFILGEYAERITF